MLGTFYYLLAALLVDGAATLWSLTRRRGHLTAASQLMVFIEGNIAAGKSTLLRRLQDEYPGPRPHGPH